MTGDAAADSQHYALFHSTSQLRRVELDSPAEAIGKNTIQAVQSGLVLGYAEMVKGMVARFDKELGGGSKVVATGGLAAVIENEAGVFDAVNPDLLPPRSSSSTSEPRPYSMPSRKTESTSAALSRRESRSPQTPCSTGRPSSDESS